MGSAAMIPLSYQTPTFQTAGQSLSQGLGLVNLAQNAQLNTQRLQQQTIATQQAQQDQADQQTAQQEFINNGGDFDKTRAALVGKVQMKTLNQMDTDHQRVQQAYLEKVNADRTAGLTTMQQYQAGVNAKAQKAVQLLQVPAGPQRVAAAQQAIQELNAAGVKTDGFQFDPQNGPTDQQLHQLSAGSTYESQLINNANATAEANQRKAQADAAAAKETADQKQRHRADTANQYLAISGLPPEEQQAAHDKIIQSLPKDIANEYSGFTKYTPQTASLIEKMALTPEQRAVETKGAQQLDITRSRMDIQQQIADIRKSTSDATRDLDNARIGLLNEQLARLQQGLPRNANEERQMVESLATRAMADSKAGGGRDPGAADKPTREGAFDDAAHNVQEYYPDDALMNRYRQQVVQTLRQWKTKPELMEQNLRNAETRGTRGGATFDPATGQIIAPGQAAGTAAAKTQTGASAGATAGATAKTSTPPPGQPKKPQTWNVGGKTFTEGQTIYGPDGTPHVVTGVVNGKIQADPVR